MSNQLTPETNAAILHIPASGHYSAEILEVVNADVARRLERERNEDRKTLARLRQDLQDPPADVQEAVLDKLKLRDAIPNLTDFLEWNKFADRGMTLLEALTILNNRHLEAVAAVQVQRNLLLEACVNLENDDGSIPKSAWDMIQVAVAEVGGTPKEISDETFREAYQQRCRMRDTDALAIELRESLLKTEELAIRLRNSLGLALEFFNNWDGVPMWTGLSEAQDALTEAKELLP